MAYTVWQSDDGDNDFAWLDPRVKPELQAKASRLQAGEACAGWFPPHFVVSLDKSNGNGLANAIPNEDGWLFVDAAVKAVLEANAEAGTIEFLPARVCDSRGTVVDRDYWLANVLRVVDCVDMERSECEPGDPDEDRIYRFSHLVLDEARIPASAPLFRLASKPSLVLVREDLVKRIRAAKLTGMRFPTLQQFTALGS